MDEVKRIGLNILHYHISKQMLEKFLKQGLLTKEEFERADSYLYERYKINKSLGQFQADICNKDEYISLTDIARQHDADKPSKKSRRQ